jgi:isopenicillin N synthase-like dioxygenase
LTAAAPIAPVPLALHDTDFAGFAAALGASFERYGFAIIEGHGLDPALIEDARSAVRALFALPAEAKARYVVPGGAGQRGYTPFRVETAKGAAEADLKEFWHVGREPAGGLEPNVWPDEVGGFRSALGALYAALDRLGLTLMRGVAAHLGLAPDAFAPALAGGDSVLRLLHYPPVETAGAAIRAAPHEDINAITLLLGAEEAGLEILDRDGRWLALEAPSGALVVNIGDMLQRLTNHVLPSTSHRVANPIAARAGHARYSMPFFVHFAPDYLIRTLPGCVSAGRPDRYPQPITARAFLEERLRDINLVA